jgi:hypothetical protein
MTEPNGPAPTGPDANEPPPWELAGVVRRDAEPHRGGLLLLLARAAYACSAVSLLLTSATMALVPEVLSPRQPMIPPRRVAALLLCGCGGALALAGVVLGAAVRRLAERDLGRMGRTQMDAGGQDATAAARHRAAQAALLGGVLLASVVAVVLLWGMH